MPRVGSSRMSTSGLFASQRPMSTFCMLPPESDWICVLEDGHLMLIFLTFSCTRSSIFLSLMTMPISRYWSRLAMEMLSAMESTPMMPVARRSSVSSAMPCLMASRGRVILSSCPLYLMVPLLCRRMPNRPSISSVRCAPTRPATPRISPLRTLNVQLRKERGLMEVKSFTSKTTSPGTLWRSGNRLVSSRPTIWVMILSVVSSFASQVPM